MSRLYKRIFAGFVCLVAGAAFGFLGYLYINSQTTKPVENTESRVPYSSLPDNAGVMFCFYDEKIFTYLDFENEQISVIFANDADVSSGYIYGYRIDYTVKANNSLAAGVIDLVGGVELNLGEETLRYTGVQVTDVISKTVDSDEIKRQVITAFFKKSAELGLSRSDLVYIIENSETDLTVPKCYYWTDNIAKMAEKTVILN